MTKWDEFQAQKENKQEEESGNKFFIGKTVLLKDLNPEIIYKEWLWENFLAKRHVTLLVAYWKAGKSTMLRALFAAMEKEQEFAGEPTKKCNILVVTEEPEEDWVEKREEFDLENNECIYILSRPFKGKPTLKQWPEVIELLIKECIEHKIDLLVFDTISTFFPINREKDSDEWLNALIPLYEFTRLNIAVLLVHHFRKGAGDEMQAFRGSGVLGSFPSNIIEFIRDPEGYFYRRVLKTGGRFAQAQPRTLIELKQDSTYTTLGDPIVVSKQHRKAKVTTIFTQSKEPLCSRDVFNLFVGSIQTLGEITITLKSIQNYIKELLNENIIVLADERQVGDKKTPFYALKEGFQQQKEMEFLYNTYTPLSSASEPATHDADENGAQNTTIGSLSSALGQNEARADENGGTSVRRTTNNEIPKPDPRW